MNISLKAIALLTAGCITLTSSSSMYCNAGETPVDYVNPYIGNISHLLVPTFPTVHLPNSMLRVYPQRSDYTTEYVNGLPVVVTHHRERSAFNISPTSGAPRKPVTQYNYDNEVIKPYFYSVELNDNTIKAEYAPSHQSAVYALHFNDGDAHVTVSTPRGQLTAEGNHVSGWQQLSNNTRIYLYLETEQKPESIKEQKNGKEGSSYTLCFKPSVKDVNLRYGISLISEEQAKKNLKREIHSYDVKAVAEKGREAWNEALGAITVEGADKDKETFYTSLYRTFERPICLSEDGRYFSAFDGQVHSDNGTPFYTDDWIWDTYRAAHPLRILINQDREEAILHSFLEMADQMGNGWMPTFPELTGDSRRMNSNHGVASVADAMVKGLAIDTLRAYEACRKAIEEKTLMPWSAAPANDIDEFYHTKGYIPALANGEEETNPNVSRFEKRQPVAVTLGTAYDEWCLSRIADALGKKDDAERFLRAGANYRNLFNRATSFFHPKDKDGKFIEPFDYRWSGGMGAREYYGENNGWVYRWDVPHNVSDLIELMGGPEKFAANLDRTFAEPLGRGKYDFYSQLPDHTGNVGQFSMANEPSLHVPYLYNYAGKPWKTQKRIRQMLDTWFRPDLMGIPGDEDGGGMTSFVVFSQLGFYPVTPGFAAYNIGSPVFPHSTIKLSNGRTFEIIANGASRENKYIQSARLNGKEWNQPWFSHEDLMKGGKLELEMSPTPNKKWGSAPGAVPPSAGLINTGGNPAFEGWYADPEGIKFGDEYWVFPTTSAPYNEQTYFNAFSSKDLVNWTLHPRVLTNDSVKWAWRAMWAPSIIEANNKYYFFFGANDVHEGEVGGIGVAVADRPEGPYSDALGKPLINDIVNGAQPIDQFVFRDKDGQHYMFYGGWGHCNVVRLAPDLLSIVPFEDGTIYKEVTPENYVEGPFMFIRDGKYIFMWSEGGWTGDSYRVAYAISDSPFGPFKREGVILETDPDVATGAGHNSVVKGPGKDEYYIVYHRHPLGAKDGNNRVTCIDRMYFDKDGKILPIKMTFTGVEPVKATNK